MPSQHTDDISHTPEVLLATHERLRRENFPLVSLIAGRRVSDSRVFVSTWLKSRQQAWLLPPEPSPEAVREVYRYWYPKEILEEGTGSASGPWLLFVGHLLDSLRAAAAIIAQYPTLPIAIATSADALVATLLDQKTPAQLASVALRGLVSVEPIEDRILTTVITARSLAPLLRSPYEGLIYYMLEARPATRGRFATNRRLSKPGGSGSYEVDLVSDDAKLIIEIDGTQHRAPVQVKRDETKQRDLEALGYRVRRFSTLQVSTDPVGVWHLIAQQLQMNSVHA